jgi:hypothetical protein
MKMQEGTNMNALTAAGETSASAVSGKSGKKKKAREDLRFRLAYTKPELSLVLPFGHTTLEELIKRGAFPDGLRPHPTAHKIWPRRIIEEWLEKSQTQAGRP